MPHTRARRPSLFGWRSVWGRWLALFALVFALPATQHVVRELASVACEAATDGCGDDCGDGTGVCLDGCGHCACCQPPMAPLLAPLPLAVVPSERGPAMPSRVDDPPLGVVASPFRPPTA